MKEKRNNNNLNQYHNWKVFFCNSPYVFKIIIRKISMYTSICRILQVRRLRIKKRTNGGYIKWSCTHADNHKNQFKPINYFNNASCDLLSYIPHKPIKCHWTYVKHRCCSACRIENVTIYRFEHPRSWKVNDLPVAYLWRH